MVSADVEKYVLQVLKKAYGKKKMSRYSKKVKSLAKKKKSKKNALHLQFKFVDKLIDHNLRKMGYMPRKNYNQRKKNTLKSLHKYSTRRMYKRVNNKHVSNPYKQVSDTYKAMNALEYIEQQRKELDKYKNHNEDPEKKEVE